MGIADVVRKAKEHTKIDEERVLKAYHFAERAHAGQTRMSGEPYIVHPVAVTAILAGFGADEDSLIAALLHDVVEDTSHTLSEIEQSFGKPVAKMVDALTKLPHVHGQSDNDAPHTNNKIESIRKIFEVMQDDVRVIVIKLCDRLHNMQSLDAFRPEKQMRIAQETLDIFVKIADRLCIGDLKEQLEELSFRFLYPDIYSNQKKKETLAIESFKKGRKSIEEKLLRLPESRRKQIIFQTHVVYPELKQVLFQDSEISHDITVITQNEQDCFLVLHDIHEFWHNIRGTFRDYATLPRSNGYQGLWTSVVKSDGSILRFIIQTKKMADYSHKGVMIDCFSGEGQTKKIRLPWVEHLKKIHQETKDKSDDYLTALENDILKGSIIVYTGDNKRLFLPPRATALDAALLHLGRHAYRLDEVTVDQHPVQLSHRLKDWQTIHFHLSAKETISPKWLQLVQTSYSRTLIFEHLKTLPTQRQHHIAEDLLQQEIAEIGFGYLDEISQKRRQQVAKKLECKTWSELLEGICAGRHDVPTVVRMLYDQAIFEVKKFSVTLQVRRHNGPEGISSIIEFLQENNISFKHNTTVRKSDTFIDEFSVEWSMAQRSQFFSYVKEFLHFDLVELRPLQTSIVPYLYAFAVPLFWALNTYVTRYLLQSGLTVGNATEMRFVSSTIILFLLSSLMRRYYHEDYSPLKFSWSFFFIAGVLTVYTYLIHETLSLTVSINYIVPVSVSFVLVGLLHAFKTIFSRRTLLPVAATLTLCVVSLALLFAQPLTQSELMGIVLACVVLFLHMTYNYFGNRYQQKNRVKSRSMLLVASMFCFASIVFLPFIDLKNFLAATPFVILLAFANGLLTGGISHFFFFESGKYLHHYKVTLAMSLMVVFTAIMGYVWDGSINAYSLGASILMVLAYCTAAYHEWASQEHRYDSIRQLG